MKNERPLIRRTFLQERFEVLIKKQLTGDATFKDLIELDEIINRDPKLREIILEEMNEAKHPPQNHGPQDIIENTPAAKPQSIIERIKSFFSRLFTIKTGLELNFYNN
jgi:hypothetical protein